MKLHARHRAVVRREFFEALPGGEVPQPGAAVLPAAHHPLPVGGELAHAHAAVVAFVRVDAPLPSHVPHLQVGVQRPGGEELAERVEVHALAVAAVSDERAHRLGLLQVPELQRASRGARHHHLLVRVERDALHRGLMAGHGQNRGRFAHREEIHPLVLAARHHHAGGSTDLKAVHRAGVRGEFLGISSEREGGHEKRRSRASARRGDECATNDGRRGRWPAAKPACFARRSLRGVPTRRRQASCARRGSGKRGRRNCRRYARLVPISACATSPRALLTPRRRARLCGASQPAARLGRLVF